MAETRKQKIKRLYELNQNGLDKALLSVILALPPVLIFLYDKFDKTNTMACHLYLWAIIISFVILVLFLFGFCFAKWGCNADDFANNKKCKYKSRYQNFANICFKVANFLEFVYLLGICSILCFLFALFYTSLIPEEAKELSLNSQQLIIYNNASMNTKTAIKCNNIEKEN